MYVYVLVRMHVYTYTNFTILAVGAYLCAFVCMLLYIVMNSLRSYSIEIILLQRYCDNKHAEFLKACILKITHFLVSQQIK